MKKRFLSFSLVLILLVGILPMTYAAGGNLGNFQRVHTYAQGQFTDIPSSAWYAENVATAYELGLMKGSSGDCFNINGNLTVAEAVAMAARLHSIYTTGTEQFSQSDPWYQVYVNDAISNGIIYEGEFTDYTAAATRLQFAVIFAAALPAEALTSLLC